MSRILGITVPAPWAWAIHVGNAAVINRTWAPPEGTRGDYLAVHASRARDDAARKEEDAIRAHVALHCGVAIPDEMELAPLRGHVVAVARLKAVSSHANDAAVLRNPSGWAKGPVAWWLDDVTPVDFVQAAGGTRLWELSPDVLAAVRDSWRQRKTAALSEAQAYRELSERHPEFAAPARRGPPQGQAALAVTRLDRAAERPADAALRRLPPELPPNAEPMPTHNPCRCARGVRFLSWCPSCRAWWCDSPGHPKHPLPSCTNTTPQLAAAGA